MSRRVKEFIDIGDFSSLDDLIAKLVTVRDGLPNFAEAEMRLKGDEIFGRKLTISYMREQTAEEAAYDERYADAIRGAQQQMLGRVQAELSDMPAERKRRAA
ncbi:hypothetical protein [Sphingomonas alba]|uniref:Uncharacterized protein n=1 Tax=Sphingomonas alba TaxID=2908208 RepID=A0ABT0RJ72_9SPHN|nr:hypothetical protein [Sphingomonas alba]MCL6682655.1 hypothetical protein [Sphingomonas alba]